MSTLLDEPPPQLSCLSWNWNFASGEITSPPEEDSDDSKTPFFYCIPESGSRS